MVSVIAEACLDVKCLEKTGVVCTAIIHEDAIDCLDPSGAVFVKRLGFGVRGGDLWFV